MSDLKELEAIERALVGFESSSHGFNLSPDIDKGFRVPGPGANTPHFFLDKGVKMIVIETVTKKTENLTF